MSVPHSNVVQRCCAIFPEDQLCPPHSEWVVIQIHIKNLGDCLHSSSSFICSTRMWGRINSEGTAVLLMHCPLLVRVGIWNLAMVLAIACVLFVKDTNGSLASTNECWQIERPFDFHLRDGNALMNRPASEPKDDGRLTVYTWVGIQTYAR